MAMNATRKKGMFFTIDSVIAASIVVTVVLYISSIYVNEQYKFNLNYASQDLARTLATLKVKDSDNGYIKSLIADGTIENKDNTILEQAGEFWADNEINFANKTISNATSLLIPSNIGFGVWIGDEAVFTKDVPLKSSLVSSKIVLSGIKAQSTTYSRQNLPSLWGPITVEVRVWQ